MVAFLPSSHQAGTSISGTLAPSGIGNERKVRSVFRKLRRTTENIPAFTVPRDELITKVLGGIRLRSAFMISSKNSFRSSWVLPRPT
jgi:hypothetical protein